MEKVRRVEERSAPRVPINYPGKKVERMEKKKVFSWQSRLHSWWQNKWREKRERGKSEREESRKSK